MINRVTRITVLYCPVEDGEVDYDQECDGCEYQRGLNSDGEVLCDYKEDDK